MDLKFIIKDKIITVLPAYLVSAQTGVKMTMGDEMSELKMANVNGGRHLKK